MSDKAAIYLDNGVRVSADGRKVFLSGKQELVFKQIRPDGKLETDGTDEVELLEVLLHRIGMRGIAKAAEKAVDRMQLRGHVTDFGWLAYHDASEEENTTRNTTTKEADDADGENPGEPETLELSEDARPGVAGGDGPAD